ncbi:MAG: hypothetical protein M3137_06580 [Actinomycetota bacterium]|nr:hypothetical protein [Actinomycetota bacterium]
MAGEAVTPRALAFLTVKRNVALISRTYGHWWIELDGEESYGWWPAQVSLRFRDALRGVPGVLNGVGVIAEGTTCRDPRHGEPADHEFHPMLVVADSDDDVRAGVRAFASQFAGEWRWSTRRPTMNCRVFQLALFDAVGLVDGTGNYHTRGGCPALAPLRRMVARVTGRRRWPRNLPAPGAAFGGCVELPARCRR